MNRGFAGAQELCANGVTLTQFQVRTVEHALEWAARVDSSRALGSEAVLRELFDAPPSSRPCPLAAGTVVLDDTQVRFVRVILADHLAKERYSLDPDVALGLKKSLALFAAMPVARDQALRSGR